MRQNIKCFIHGASYRFGVCSWKLMPNFITASHSLRRTSGRGPKVAWSWTCAIYTFNRVCCQLRDEIPESFSFWLSAV